MLRVAATLLALLAVVPAVTPLLGGYKVFTSECGRNLTHLGPSRKWPEFPARTYNYTGLLVMPGDVCSGTLVTPKFMLSTSLCREWKDNVNYANDIEEDGSEVRIGIIQGEVPRHLYQSQLVARYLHYDRKIDRPLSGNPLMLVEVQEEFDGWTKEMLPGVYRKTPLSASPGRDVFLMLDVVGYENSANVPIYHQSIFDARVWQYDSESHKYGGTPWIKSHLAAVTYDVSPVRTVCSMDRGAPLMTKKNIAGIVLGIVDDMETPGNFCGDSRIHYNIFLTLDGRSADWIDTQTEGMVKIMELIDGKPFHVNSDYEEHPTARPARPALRPRPAATTTRRPRKNGSGRKMVSVGPLLFSVAVTIVRLLFQY